MTAFQPYMPDRDHLSTAELRDMARLLNIALRAERSRISVQERARLDRITNAKQQAKSGYKLFHPKFVQIVERDGDGIVFGFEKISQDELLDRVLNEYFHVNYFSIIDLNSELRDMCLLLRSFLRDQFRNNHNVNFHIRNISQFIVVHLCGVYYRIFGLPPYLGGVGANEADREPNSPFAVFACSTLKGLGIRTRTGSFYAPDTLKNLMPKGSLATSVPEGDEELVAARYALEVAMEIEREASGGKRGRGRPRKPVMVGANPADIAKSTPARK